MNAAADKRGHGSFLEGSYSKQTARNELENPGGGHSADPCDNESGVQAIKHSGHKPTQEYRLKSSTSSNWADFAADHLIEFGGSKTLKQDE